MRLIFWLLAVAAVAMFAIAFWASGPVEAQSFVCGTYDDFQATIVGKYEEQVLGKGLTMGGEAIVQLTASDTTFTILVIYPNGRACMISAGKDWTIETPTKKGKDS